MNINQHYNLNIKKIIESLLAISLIFISVSLTSQIITNIETPTKEFYFLICASFIFYLLVILSFINLLVYKDYTYYYYNNFLLTSIIYFTITSLETGSINNLQLPNQNTIIKYLDTIRIFTYYLYTMFALHFLNVKQIDKLSYKMVSIISKLFLVLFTVSFVANTFISSVLIIEKIQNILLLSCTPLGAAAILILLFRIRGLISFILGVGSASFLIASGFTYLFTSQIIPYPSNHFPFTYPMFYNIMGTLLESIMFFGSFTYRSKLILERDAKEKIRLANIRTDIAKDLHDEIGATLTSINILSQVSHQIIKEEPVKAAEMISQISLQSKTVQQNMSDIVWSLRADTEDTHSLLVRMREFAVQILEPINIKTYFELQPILETYKLPISYKKEMLLIYKEAINNIAKHSGASVVEISLHKTLKSIALRIKDNGTWKGTTSGFGTKSMNDRANVLNGKLEITPISNGTLVKLEVPIP